MISVLVAVVVAVAVVGVLILRERGRRGMDSGVPAFAGWVSFACGVLGVFAVATPMVDSWLAEDGVDRLGQVAPWLFPASIVLGLVGLTTGVFALWRHDRSWRTWVGLVTAGLVMAFWLLFAVGEALSVG